MVGLQAPCSRRNQQHEAGEVGKMRETGCAAFNRRTHTIWKPFGKMCKGTGGVETLSTHCTTTRLSENKTSASAEHKGFSGE